MAKDNLGAISTAHLIHGDRDPMKARSATCLRLAKLHSSSVDFAKSGSHAEMPKILKPKEYPHFMERIDKPMYHSQSILGKLYDAMSTKLCKKYVAAPSIKFDYDLKVNGFESFLPAAITHRDHYAEKLRDLMEYFGASSEDEILTGNIRKKLTHWSTDRRKQVEVKEKILSAVGALQEEAAGWLKGYRGDDQKKVASAWYYVTYYPDFYVQEKTFLSFPWVLCDTLLNIKTQKRLQKRLRRI